MSTRRRGRGEGSITLRTDGRWMGRIDLGPGRNANSGRAANGRAVLEPMAVRRGQAASSAANAHHI